MIAPRVVRVVPEVEGVHDLQPWHRQPARAGIQKGRHRVRVYDVYVLVLDGLAELQRRQVIRPSVLLPRQHEHFDAVA